MADGQPSPPSTETRRRMTAVRRTRTEPEMRLRRELHRRGLRYRVDFRPEPGLRTRADVVFTKVKVAVFVDGCFWHGCPDHATTPSTNTSWWMEKIETNRARDRRATESLTTCGWDVLRVWEHEDHVEVADRIEARVSHVGEPHRAQFRVSPPSDGSGREGARDPGEEARRR